MPKILLIAQGEYIADYGRQIQDGLDDAGRLGIVVAHMEDALAAAKRYPFVRCGIDQAKP